MLSGAARRIFRSVGLEVRRARPSTGLADILRMCRVDTVFDIGANVGQSARHLRGLGFRGTIVSFEPVGHLFERLRMRASGDPHWLVEQAALGRFAGQLKMNVSGGHSGASSLLEMTDNVYSNAPDQRVVRTEDVAVTTLASAMDKHYPLGDRCFLKLDVQGSEKAVLEGGLDRLGRVVGMKIEMSLVENYKGETLLNEMLPYLYALGFRAAAFDHGWSDPLTRELFQVDCVLFRPVAARR